MVTDIVSISTDQVASLWRDARRGDHRAIGRLLTLVELGEITPEAPADVTETHHRPRSIGITGAPGVGKSTLVAALTARLRELGKRTAVVAVDPSSPITGGALLGDRIRMGAHTSDRDVFIRSMATRGNLGGLARSTEAVAAALAQLDFEIVIIETVGVGQSEVAIASVADVTIVVLAPGAGDGVQLAKAGLVEVADVFVINKADKGGTSELARELDSSLRLGPGAAARIFEVSASIGTGVDELVSGHIADEAQ
jgi:LAO/AO transport system kinase